MDGGQQDLNQEEAEGEEEEEEEEAETTLTVTSMTIVACEGSKSSLYRRRRT